jgi:CBS domain containing-hemolysin-like protein
VIGAWVLAVAAVLTAAICATADGALLGEAEQPPSGEGSTLPHGDRRDVAHRALSIGRVVMQLIAGVAAAIALQLDQRAPGAAIALALAAALVVMTLGETIPRALGDALGAAALRALTPAVRVIELALMPLVAVGNRLDAALQRLIPPTEPREEDRDATAEQFRQVVQAEAGVPGDQRAILHRVFELGDTEVQEVMVPRVDMIGVERQTPWSEVLDRVRSSQHARLPVYEDTLDHVVGILFAKDLLAAVLDDAEPAEGWESLVRSATFIPESKTIDAQLRDFKSSRTHIAIVVDEYGGTAGLITIEDILEEIVGDIRDEYDREEPPIVAEQGRRFWVSGRVTLDELSEVLGHDFEREDVTTVGGLVFECLGRVPRAGEQLTLEGFRVVVERVVRRRIDRVYFERLEMAEQA